MLHGCGQPAMDAKTAHYEAQKLLVVIDGKASAAAFVDRALQDDETYAMYFTNGLHKALAAAPAEEPAFTPYRACVVAGENLAKFAELRRKGGGQNAESDKYRQPFWSSLEACKKAVGAG